MQDDVAAIFLKRLDELGLRLRSSPSLDNLSEGLLAPGVLDYQDSSTTCEVLYTKNMTASSLARGQTATGGGAVLFVVGTRITERSAEVFRQLGVNYLDQAGNASIRFGSVLIDVRGRRTFAITSPNQSLDRGQAASVNLFSVKRAQVIFALLSWPGLVESPLRTIARVAHVSLGQVQDTLNLLQTRHYVDHSGTGPRKLLRTSELSELWAHSYQSGLGASLELLALEGSIESPAGFQGTPIYVSGESAVPQHLRPTSLTLYVDETPRKLIVANRWRSSPTPNILMRQKFWEEPEGNEPQMVGPYLQVPQLLVYADLLSTNEPRQREVAEQLRTSNAELQRL